MSDTQAKGGNDFKSETKYKQFSVAIEKALKTFEGLTEWHDLISSLAKINKVGFLSMIGLARHVRAIHQ
jgi:hypothetical protein